MYARNRLTMEHAEKAAGEMKGANPGKYPKQVSTDRSSAHLKTVHTSAGGRALAAARWAKEWAMRYRLDRMSREERADEYARICLQRLERYRWLQHLRTLEALQAARVKADGEIQAESQRQVDEARKPKFTQSEAKGQSPPPEVPTTPPKPPQQSGIPPKSRRYIV